jgi:hypothetical protein
MPFPPFFPRPSSPDPRIKPDSTDSSMQSSFSRFLENRLPSVPPSDTPDNLGFLRDASSNVSPKGYKNPKKAQQTRNELGNNLKKLEQHFSAGLPASMANLTLRNHLYSAPSENRPAATSILSEEQYNSSKFFIEQQALAQQGNLWADLTDKIIQEARIVLRDQDMPFARKLTSDSLERLMRDLANKDKNTASDNLIYMKNIEKITNLRDEFGWR